MIPRRCPRAHGKLRWGLVVVVTMIWRRRRWWRVVIVVVVIVTSRLGCRLGGGLLHRLDDGGVAAGERQQGCAAEKEGGERVGSNHSV